MPFGLDLKSVIVGLILAYFVVPWVQAFFLKSRASVAAPQ